MEGECDTPHEHELLEERAAAEKHHTPANVHVAVRAPAGPPAPAFDGSSGDGGGLLATDAASETHRDAMVIAHSLSVAAMSPSPVKRSADLRQQNRLQDAAQETEKPEAAVIELTDDPEALARLCTLLASSNYQDTASQQAATSLFDDHSVAPPAKKRRRTGSVAQQTQQPQPHTQPHAHCEDQTARFKQTREYQDAEAIKQLANAQQAAGTDQKVKKVVKRVGFYSAGTREFWQAHGRKSVPRAWLARRPSLQNAPALLYLQGRTSAPAPTWSAGAEVDEMAFRLLLRPVQNFWSWRAAGSSTIERAREASHSLLHRTAPPPAHPAAADSWQPPALGAPGQASCAEA